MVQGILRYLVEHPDAKDTVEGIVKWWRLQDQVEWEKEEVQKALDFLTSNGWLSRREITPYKKIYGINKDKLEEIKNFGSSAF